MGSFMKYELHTEQSLPCESTTEEVSFEWLHHGIWSTETKVNYNCMKIN